MTRITCKKCRRIGESLCGREKCAYKKRPTTPGLADASRKHKSTKSEYGEQLLNKQKMKVIYGLREAQFSNYVFKAMKTSKDTTSTLYTLLESRLDNVVFRSGLAETRALARQLVSHGHIVVNNKNVNVPSYSTREGDIISIREGSKITKYFSKLFEKFNPTLPSWITADLSKKQFTIKSTPKDINNELNLASIIEFYSR